MKLEIEGLRGGLLKKENLMPAPTLLFGSELAGETVGAEMVKFGGFVTGKMRTLVAASLFRTGDFLDILTRVVVQSTGQ